MAGRQAFKTRVSQQKSGSQAEGLRKTTLGATRHCHQTIRCGWYRRSPNRHSLQPLTPKTCRVGDRHSGGPNCARPPCRPSATSAGFPTWFSVLPPKPSRVRAIIHWLNLTATPHLPTINRMFEHTGFNFQESTLNLFLFPSLGQDAADPKRRGGNC
jgi:hypothetical protein